MVRPLSRFLLFAVLALGSASSALGGEVHFYATITYDHPNQVVTGYAGTIVNYSTAYYYETVVAGVLDKDGNYLDDDAQRNTFGSSEVWVHDNNLSPGATYELTTYHRLDATYEYYQIVEDCEPYCSWWGDKYGFSLIPTGGPPSGWDEYFNRSGPATPVETTTSIESDQYRKSMGDCNDLPTGEILYWLGGAYPSFTNNFQFVTIGAWSQEVLGSSSSYKDRLVKEENGGLMSQDTCYFQGSEVQQVAGFSNPSTWTVGYIDGQPAGNNA